VRPAHLLQHLIHVDAELGRHAAAVVRIGAEEVAELAQLHFVSGLPEAAGNT